MSSQWDVNDVVELLTLYEVPKHALNFIFRHSIDGMTMNESVVHIVKDLNINNSIVEGAIVAKLKQIIKADLMPSEVLTDDIDLFPSEELHSESESKQQ